MGDQPEDDKDLMRLPVREQKARRTDARTDRGGGF